MWKVQMCVLIFYGTISFSAHWTTRLLSELQGSSDLPWQPLTQLAGWTHRCTAGSGCGALLWTSEAAPTLWRDQKIIWSVRNHKNMLHTWPCSHLTPRQHSWKQKVHLPEALSWSMFFSWSRSREMGWSRTVKVQPSFSSWSSSRFCCSLRELCSEMVDFCTDNQSSEPDFPPRVQVRARTEHEANLFVSLYLRDQQEFVKQEQINVDQLCVLW